MDRTVVASIGGRPVVLLDTITAIVPADAGAIVVSGSHGGRSAGEYAARVAVALCCFNDAGVGKDAAGIAALAMLDARATAAVACSHASARIGDARDTWEHGVIAHLNRAAARAGFRAGEPLQAAVTRVFGP